MRQRVLNQVSSLCGYSDAFIVVTGGITVTANNNKDVAFKNCAPFITCMAEIIVVFIDEASHIYIAMIVCNDYYLDTWERLWYFKRDEVPNNNNDNLTADNSQLFKYKAALVGKTTNAVKNTNSAGKAQK